MTCHVVTIHKVNAPPCVWQRISWPFIKVPCVGSLLPWTQQYVGVKAGAVGHAGLSCCRLLLSHQKQLNACTVKPPAELEDSNNTERCPLVKPADLTQSVQVDVHTSKSKCASQLARVSLQASMELWQASSIEPGLSVKLGTKTFLIKYGRMT